jgi:erythromycin esterase-like protein
MAQEGMVNVGQLLREQHDPDHVFIIDFGTYEGTVIAADAWGDPYEAKTVPPARKEALNKSCIRQVAMISGSALQRRTLFFKTPSVIEQSALSMILILNTMEIMFLQRWRIGMMLLFILIKQPLSIHWQLKS